MTKCKAAERNSQRETNASGRPPVKKVELLFLGTGAADWPSKYPPSEKHLKKGEVRGMSSVLIKGHILIDCGPTVLDAMNRHEARQPAASATLAAGWRGGVSSVCGLRHRMAC